MYQKLWSDDVWFLKYGCDRCNYLGHFFPFYPRNSPENQNFEEMKKSPQDIIILHSCTKNYDQMMYGSWDMVCDICNYFSFWAIFYPFTPVTAWKIKILKKWNKKPEISSFYICVKKLWSDDIWFLRYGAWQM